MLSPHFKVRKETLPVRCEICHQSDQFDPQSGICYRCRTVPLQILASSVVEGDPPAPQTMQQMGSYLTPRDIRFLLRLQRAHHFRVGILSFVAGGVLLFLIANLFQYVAKVSGLILPVALFLLFLAFKHFYQALPSTHSCPVCDEFMSRKRGDLLALDCCPHCGTRWRI